MVIRLALLTALVLLQSELADEQEYRERMREIDHSFSEMRRQEQVRGGPAIEQEAAKLSELFGNVEEFWKGRGEEQAASFARMAKDGADEARTAARDRNEKALEVAMDTIAASCEGCHKEPLDKYRFRLTE